MSQGDYTREISCIGGDQSSIETESDDDFSVIIAKIHRRNYPQRFGCNRFFVKIAVKIAGKFSFNIPSLLHPIGL